MRPQEPPSAQELEDEFKVISELYLKPRILTLCPPTIVVYVLRTGEWSKLPKSQSFPAVFRAMKYSTPFPQCPRVQKYNSLINVESVNIDAIQDVEFQDMLWDDLIIPEGEKEVLLALVMSNLESDKGSSISTGYGERTRLTVLLHGGPGTGKTFTAACIAEKTRRPLLLGSIEIGSSMDVFEQSLNNNLRLSERWKDILLIEDVDPFVYRSNEYDSSHEAFFSKTIQAIENYSGILCLTTRRVGSLDEAIISRIDYTVHYGPLPSSALESIWRSALRYDHVDLDWKHLGSFEGLNDKNIQSLVHLARRLASYNKERINMRTINAVLQSRTDFTHYMAQVSGDDDPAQWAMRRGYRDDRFQKIMEKEQRKSPSESVQGDPAMPHGLSSPYGMQSQYYTPYPQTSMAHQAQSQAHVPYPEASTVHSQLQTPSPQRHMQSTIPNGFSPMGMPLPGSHLQTDSTLPQPVADAPYGQANTVLPLEESKDAENTSQASTGGCR